MLIIIFIPVTISPSSTSQQRDVPKKNALAYKLQLSTSNQGKVCHQWPLKVFTLFFFLSFHCWETKCLIIPWHKNLLGVILCLGKHGKLEYVQMLNRLSWPELAINQYGTDHLLHGSDHYQLSYMTPNQQQRLRIQASLYPVPDFSTTQFIII